MVRYRPDGSVERIVQLPIKHPTCSAFGGAALDRLHVISSRLDHSADELARMPEAGSLFVCDLAIAGLPENRVAGA